MRLHIIRHGQTRHNVEGRIQGDVLDDPLDETGLAQADALFEHYLRERARGLVVGAVYTSPLRRAAMTAERIARALDAPAPRPLPGLREISWGHYNGRDNEGATREHMDRILAAWDQGDLTASAPGGETPHDGWARAQKEIEPLLERHAREDVILVAHGRINKILLSGLLHGELHHMERYPQTNAGITLLEGPPWRLLTPNHTAHLAGLDAREERVS